MTYEYYTINKQEIALNSWLRQKLDIIKKLQEKKWDTAFLIDGAERVGKSTLAMTCGWYLSDGKLTIDNICKGSMDAKKKIRDLPDGSVMIVDESSLIFGSSDAMTKEQKELIKILNVVGQKRMIFILVCPSFFKLNWDIAVRRTRFLLHVYATKNLERGRFTYFGEKRKKILLEYGRKHYGSYSYPKANFNGNFKEFNPFGQSYLDLKKDTLYELLEQDNKQQKINEALKKNRIETFERFKEWVKLKGIKITKKEVAQLIGQNTHIERLGRFTTPSPDK